MPLWPVIVVAVALLVVWSLVPGIRHGRYRRGIRKRSSAHAEWAAEFLTRMPLVEQVLGIFCDALLFQRQYRFHFRPEDRVANVYHGTTGPVADKMQLETLALKLRAVFGVYLGSVLNENTTLRDIVALVVAQELER